MSPSAAHTLHSANSAATTTDITMLSPPKNRAAMGRPSAPPLPPLPQIEAFKRDVVHYIVNTVAPLLIRRKDVYLGKDTLSKLKIKQGDLSLATGEPNSSTKFPKIFSRPMPPSRVEKVLSEVGFSQQERDFTEVDEWYEGDSYEGAMAILCFMTKLLIEDSKAALERYGGGHLAIASLSSWRMIRTSMKYISRPNPPLDKPHWAVLGVWRPCLEDDGVSPWGTQPDVSRPHIFAILAEDHKIEDRVILTSEAQAILMLACNFGSQPPYQNHRLIPVTLLTGSKRTFRVVQGIVDLRTKEVEIRLSKKIKLADGPQAGWTSFYTLLGWMVAEPVDETLKR